MLLGKTVELCAAEIIIQIIKWRKLENISIYYPTDKSLTRIIHEASTAAADPGMSTAFRSVGLLDILSSMPAGPSVALAEKRQMRLVSITVCAASLRTFMNNSG
jgi:hypothetical protein